MTTSLTARELDVLSRLPLHKSAREIADELSISANTVRTHVKSIYLKLDVTSRAAAVQKAQQLGLLPSNGHAAVALARIPRPRLENRSLLRRASDRHLLEVVSELRAGGVARDDADEVM